ncbi:TPA: hypothetical protein L5685_003900 [Pseudomonas aeruginosa]|nr:hypothetical protein [Pseudomonas aeruginosa]
MGIPEKKTRHMVTPANSRKAGGGRLIHHRARYTPCRLFTSAGSPAGQTLRESEINQKGKARKLWDIEEGTGI